MKTTNTLLTAMAVLGLILLTVPATQAQTCDGTGGNFVDLNGDGFNDNAADHDGDGIPNGLDDDWVKNAQTGSGYQHQKGQGGASAAQVPNQVQTKSQKFNQNQAFNGNLYQKRIRSLQGSGSGAGVCDGSGSGSAGGGVCDGTGPHGAAKKRGGR